MNELGKNVGAVIVGAEEVALGEHANARGVVVVGVPLGQGQQAAKYGNEQAQIQPTRGELEAQRLLATRHDGSLRAGRSCRRAHRR